MNIIPVLIVGWRGGVVVVVCVCVCVGGGGGGGGVGLLCFYFCGGFLWAGIITPNNTISENYC